METVPVLPSAVQEIMDSNDERELWVVGREFERPPYFHTNEGINNRLAKALRAVSEDRVHPQSDGAFLVDGSEGRQYRCAESCSCPYSQKSRTKWCYHMVATALYTEWRKRVHTMPGQETLAFSPVTVNERLAAATTACLTHALQEDRMPQDEYIPEPDDADAPVAVADAPERKEEGKESARPLPGPVLLPSLDARALELSMQAWSAQRQVVKRFLQQELVEGTDYYTLRIGGKATKPALSKAGSEKFMALFQLHATFSQDSATWTMLGQPQGTLCYVCTLHTRGGELIGEGRGARKLQQDNGDINKAVKMAQKSAMVDAILRTGALSDVFTQDLEPDDREEPARPARPSSAELRQRIWALVKQEDPTLSTREAVEAFVHARTAYVLEPDNYQAIVRTLESQGVGR